MINAEDAENAEVRRDLFLSSSAALRFLCSSALNFFVETVKFSKPTCGLTPFYDPVFFLRESSSRGPLACRSGAGC
jgi:hypothetical protein